MASCLEFWVRLSAAFMQTEADGERLVALGLDRSRIFVTGNIKFDADSPSSIDDKLTPEFRDRFKFDENFTADCWRRARMLLKSKSYSTRSNAYPSASDQSRAC